MRWQKYRSYQNSRYRKLYLIELEQSFEVDENTLCGFGSQKRLFLPIGADLRGEHQVEGHWLRHVITSYRWFELVLGDRLQIWK